jgi:hypothetical protein
VTERPEPRASEQPLSTAELADAVDSRQQVSDPRPDDPSQQSHPGVTSGGEPPLFPEADVDELRSRWEMIQGSFVDEPRRAVEQADTLVAGAMKQLAEIFARERADLEGQWDRGDDVSTEDLRVALQRYRSFFSRLLAV